MKRLFQVFNSIIDEYGAKAFSALLLFAVTGILLLMVVIFSYSSQSAWLHALWQTDYLQEFLGFITLLGRHAGYWILRIVPLLAALAACYLVGRRLLTAADDPLFAPKVTFLSLMFLTRIAWDVPLTRAIFGEIFFDTSGISQVIAIIMLVGLATNFLQYLSLEKEHRIFLEAEQQIIGIDPEANDWLVRIDHIMKPRHSVLAQKWNNLRDVFEYTLHADYETLMAFPNQREFLKESKVSFIIKILPLLGMIGTVLGFTLAVTGMRDAATSMQDFSSFKGNMLESLGGMKNAFLTTLTGMVGMVIVMWINSLIEESRRRILLAEDEYLYITFFLPWRKHHLKTNEPDV